MLHKSILARATVDDSLIVAQDAHDHAASVIVLNLLRTISMSWHVSC